MAYDPLSKNHSPKLGRGPKVSRRGFLAASLGGALLMAPGNRLLAGMSAADTLSDARFSPNVWIEMDADGQTLINIVRAEMGQHVGTALARIVAEELEVDWDHVSISHVDTHPKWGYMVTGGSWSVFQSFVPLSQAGAAGRLVLLETGARMMGVPVDTCRAEKSRVISGDGSVSYAEIVASGTIERTLTPEEVGTLPIKPAAARTTIGRDVRAIDIPAKSRGEAEYGLDIKRPGMVYARPLMPPTRMGSRILDVDDSAARAVAGYQQTYVIDGDTSGYIDGWAIVIADSFPAAMKAADLVSVSYEAGETADVSEDHLYAHADALIDGPEDGSRWVEDGDIASAFEGADDVLDLRYTTSTMLHFQLEPVNAIAEFKDGHLHLWGGNQWQSLVLPMIAAALGLGEDQVTMHQSFLGGGFGRRLVGDYFLAAAHAARSLDKPVKLVFARPDDSVFDCVRSPTVQKVNIALGTASSGSDKAILGMNHDVAAGWPTATHAPFFLGPGVEGAKPADAFSVNGADHWYSVGAHRVTAYQNDLAQRTFVPGWWRAVGPGYTIWAVESAVDEAATALGRDPVDFRLEMLDGAGKNAGSDPVSTGGAARLAAVLRRAAEKAGWGRDLGDGRALGVALGTGQERTMPTWVATIVDVSADRETGDITLHKVTSVIDCGSVVHPDGALAQAESATLWGVSHALYEGTRFENGNVVDRNLDTYTPLRMSQVPELDIEFLDPGFAPTGLGEPPLSPVAPAIANAVARAIGVRVRHLPLRPETVRGFMS